MPSWIPVPGTTTGRLVVSALELFGAEGFANVSVGAIAERAGVTTGSLYHHFGSKAGLYQIVRADIERRVLDRLEGAAAARPVTTVADLAPVLLVGFDYLVTSGFARLLADAPDPEPSRDDHAPDEIQAFLTRLVPVKDGDTLSALIAAAWRAALDHASHGPRAASDARTAFNRLLAGA